MIYIFKNETDIHHGFKRMLKCWSSSFSDLELVELRHLSDCSTTVKMWAKLRIIYAEKNDRRK